MNYAEGNESSSSVSYSKIMSRFLLLTSSKDSNLFLMKLMFECSTVSLIGEFSFISFNPILASLIPSKEVCCLSLRLNESVKISSEPSLYFYILKLALSHFSVDELKEIPPDKATFRFMSQFLDHLSFSENY